MIAAPLEMDMVRFAVCYQLQGMDGWSGQRTLTVHRMSRDFTMILECDLWYIYISCSSV